MPKLNLLLCTAIIFSMGLLFANPALFLMYYNASKNCGLQVEVRHGVFRNLRFMKGLKDQHALTVTQDEEELFNNSQIKVGILDDSVIYLSEEKEPIRGTVKTAITLEGYAPLLQAVLDLKKHRKFPGNPYTQSLKSVTWEQDISYNPDTGKAHYHSFYCDSLELISKGTTF